jgi:hypothetical protein
VDPRAGLDDMEKWKFFTLPGLELPLPLIVQPVASRYTDWAIPESQPVLNIKPILSSRVLNIFIATEYSDFQITKWNHIK